MMKIGTVKMLHKDGFGWLSFPDQLKNVFFHASRVKGDVKFDNIEKGMTVMVDDIVEVEVKGEIKKEALGVEVQVEKIEVTAE